MSKYYYDTETDKLERRLTKLDRDIAAQTWDANHAVTAWSRERIESYIMELQSERGDVCARLFNARLFYLETQGGK